MGLVTPEEVRHQTYARIQAALSVLEAAAGRGPAGQSEAELDALVKRWDRALVPAFADVITIGLASLARHKPDAADWLVDVVPRTLQVAIFGGASDDHPDLQLVRRILASAREGRNPWIHRTDLGPPSDDEPKLWFATAYELARRIDTLLRSPGAFAKLLGDLLGKAAAGADKDELRAEAVYGFSDAHEGRPVPLPAGVPEGIRFADSIWLPRRWGIHRVPVTIEVPAGMLRPDDHISISGDADAGWVTVESVLADPDDPNMLVISYRDSDDTGPSVAKSLVASAQQTLTCRRKVWLLRDETWDFDGWLWHMPPEVKRPEVVSTGYLHLDHLPTTVSWESARGILGVPERGWRPCDDTTMVMEHIDAARRVVVLGLSHVYARKAGGPLDCHVGVTLSGDVDDKPHLQKILNEIRESTTLNVKDTKAVSDDRDA